MEDVFDANTFNSFCQNNDYTSAADYAEQHLYDADLDDNEFMDLRTKILQLRREGAIRDRRILSIKDKPKYVQESYLVNEALDNGSTLPDNNAAKRFKASLKPLYSQVAYTPTNKGRISPGALYESSLGRTHTREYVNPNPGESIYARFDNQDAYSLFMDTAGLDKEYFKSSNSYRLNRDGTVDIITSTGDKHLKNILIGLNGVMDVYGKDKGFTITDIKGKPLNNEYNDNIKAINKTFSNFDKITEEVNSIDVTLPMTPVVSSFMSASHAKIYDALQKGKINDKEYKALVDRLANNLGVLIQQHGFANTDMYLYSGGQNSGASLSFVDNTSQKDAYGEMIKTAEAEKRLTWSVGNVGGFYGTMFHISAKPNKQGVINSKDFDEDNPELVNTSYSIFVPGLFADSAEEALSMDTKTRSQVELSTMNAYKYSYPLTQKGSLSPLGKDTYIYTDELGRIETCDRARAADIMNQSMILDDMNAEIQRYSVKHPSNELKMRVNLKAAVNRSSRDKDLEDRIIAMSQYAAQELTGETEGDVYVTAFRKLYSQGMGMAGLSGKESIEFGVW